MRKSAPRISTVFVGENGVRSGWRVILFFTLLSLLIAFLILSIRAFRSALGIPSQPTTVLTPGRLLLNECALLFGVVATTAFFAKLEKRSFADYGLPLREAFGVRFGEGFFWGWALLTSVLLVLKATGNFSFGSVALTPQRMAVFGLGWALCFTIVGIAEGFAFSGYALFALARGLGYWPAAGLLSLFFGGIHFVANRGENWLGSLSLVIVGFLVAFTLRRTGSLWFAIGIHAAWDWAQSFLYGVPDSGILVAGHLLNASFHGSKWMTGGSAGPEASIVTLLGYALAFALIGIRFPKNAL